MNLMNLLDLASLFFIVGSLFSIAAVVTFQPSQLRLVADAALPIGLIGFLIGVISMLAAEADSSRIAPALAIAVLTVLYAGTIRLLLADTLNQAAPTEHSMSRQSIGQSGLFSHDGLGNGGGIAGWCDRVLGPTCCADADRASRSHISCGSAIQH